MHALFRIISFCLLEPLKSNLYGRQRFLLVTAPYIIFKTRLLAFKSSILFS